jgi:hypothetical protein
MHHLQAMLREQPHHFRAEEVVRQCIESCTECAAVCTLCADACLAEPQVQNLVACIRLDLDCAELCAATARIVGRLTKPHKATMRAALTACATACRECAAECRLHASMHGHCRVCAETCDACAKACDSLLAAMPA